MAAGEGEVRSPRQRERLLFVWEAAAAASAPAGSLPGRSPAPGGAFPPLGSARYRRTEVPPGVGAPVGGEFTLSLNGRVGGNGPEVKIILLKNCLFLTRVRCSAWQRAAAVRRYPSPSLCSTGVSYVTKRTPETEPQSEREKTNCAL